MNFNALRPFLKGFLSTLCCVVIFQFSYAQGPTTIVDNTQTSATLDGTVNPAEYVGSSTGINNGFGDVIGSGSTVSVDSDASGTLHFGFQPSLFGL